LTTEVSYEPYVSLESDRQGHEGGDGESGGSPLPVQEHGGEPGDFYADAMETV
jgi:hypothetical protein